MAVEVVFIRHAAATARDPARLRDDAKRPLTAKGRRKFRKVAAGLANWIPDVDCLLTSPLVRARQTADVLQAIAHWPTPVACPELAPGTDPGAMLGVLRRQKARRIALVGHEPDLSALVSICIAGPDAARPIELKKGGIACARFAGKVRAGRGTLTAVIPPGALRAMR